MSDFIKTNLSLNNKELKQSKKTRLLKYNETLTYLSFSKSFKIPQQPLINSQPNYKPFILEEYPNESISQRDVYIDELFIYLPTYLIFSRPSSKSMKGHYYQYNVEQIHNVYTISFGLDFFNMDDLKKSLRTSLKINKNDIFMVCSYDMFHNIDLRITFIDDLKDYEIITYNNTIYSEEDIWEGAYVSEFIRTFKECDTLGYKKSWVSYDNDFLKMSDIKVEFQLFDLLIEYFPYSLKTGFASFRGFKELDYINNNMIIGIIKFFEMRQDGETLLKSFANKLIDHLDSHEGYLLLYLALINHFKIEDEAFMHLLNQAINFIKDPFLIKQYLLLQLSFFERNKEKKFIQICYEITVKLFKLSPNEAFSQLNLIKYLYLTNNLKYDLLEFQLVNNQTDNVDITKQSSRSIKNFHFDYLLTEYSNPEIKEVENIKILTHNSTFYNFPNSKHGYLNVIWNNKEIFEDYVIEQNYFELNNMDPEMIDLFEMQLKMTNNLLITSLIKDLLIMDESFLKYLLSINYKKSPNNIIENFLVVYKKTLTFIERNKFNANETLEGQQYEKLKLLCLSYYFLGMNQSCVNITETLLNFKFDRLIFELYLKSLKHMEAFNIAEILKNIVIGLSFENRFYDKVHFTVTKFVKMELIDKRHFNSEYLINESMRSIDSFINEKLVAMIIDFYTNI